MNILITGCSGFIGFHTSLRLLKNKKNIIFGIDNLNKFYDTKLKVDRTNILQKKENFQFYKYDLNDLKKLRNLIKKYKIRIIIHLAAQAGVRYSISNPKSYFESNVCGFFNILELSRDNNIKHLIFASSSSVYGRSKKFPLTEEAETSKPLSMYAASKKTNEVMAYSYSNIYKLPITGLRFFTVYGPFGRPDMALFKFSNNIKKNYPIELFNEGKHYRDWTYIDDAVSYIVKIISKPSLNKVPFEIYNVGNSKPEKLINFVKLIEYKFSKKAKILMKSLQLGDVFKTHADITKIRKKTKIKPRTNIENGIDYFIDWFNNYYK